MGIILMLYIGAGLLGGLAVDAVGLTVGLLVIARRARTRNRVWAMALGVFGATAVLLIVAVNLTPLKPVRPGSDYDNVAANLLFQAFAYSAIPGLALIIAAISTRLCQCRGLAAPPPLPQ